MRSPATCPRRAFALVELVVCAAIVGVLVAIFMVAASDSRRTAGLGDSINNLKQFAWASSAYTGDCAERVWTFSWRAGTTPSSYPDLAFAVTDLDAAAYQAADIIRRRGNPGFPRINSWIPHILTSSLVLADQLNLKLPLPWIASPGDATRLAWQQYPANPVPLPPNPPENQRWVYSSSYELGPAFWCRDQKVGSDFTVEQSTAHNLYLIPTPQQPMGDRTITQVLFPSHKAMVWESHQRFFGSRVAYFGYPEARVPVLTVDGSVTVRATSESNRGFKPNQPTLTAPTQYTYSPASWEPAAPSGVSPNVDGRYRWTRAGLAGRDFGAAEACSGQPGCTP